MDGAEAGPGPGLVVVRQMVVRRGSVFFFASRRRHTRLQGDWSSDVCSSDLVDVVVRVDGDVRGVPEKCLRAVRVESARSAVQVSGEDADDAGGGDFADLIV